MDQPKDLEQLYLDSVVACERQSLQISKASKALSLMKTELDKLETERKNLRRQLVGNEEFGQSATADLSKLLGNLHYPPAAR